MLGHLRFRRLLTSAALCLVVCLGGATRAFFGGDGVVKTDYDTKLVQGAISVEKLLIDMVDLRQLADFPTPAYRTVQYSSYDRRSDLPEGPGWFENCDGFGGEPIPNFEGIVKEPNEEGIGEYLIFDANQPGAIVRTWAATISGKIRLYLDGNDKPIYDGPAYEFLTCPYTALVEKSGIDDNLARNAYRQFDAGYCPIPFAKSCRMTWVGDVRHTHFYHVQVRLYEPNVKVETFKVADIAANAKTIEKVGCVLVDPDKNYQTSKVKSVTTIASKVEAGASKEVASLEGTQIVEQFTLKLAAVDLDKALRKTVLHISFDGHRPAQVVSPVGDFFAAAPGINPFKSLPFTVEPDGTMTCRFAMPFKASMKVTLENLGEQSVTVTGSVQTAEYVWNDETSMHFRARWRVDHGLTGSGDGADMPYVIATGQGIYVGTAMFLLNPTRYPTTHGGWWGEGDEKVFIDDDINPSTFGTGSEDYFNYSWSVPTIFSYPYCGQPRNDGPGNRGFVTNTRWQIVDALPFQKRFAFYMELMTHSVVPNMSYARIGYHYGKPGMIDDSTPITRDSVRDLALPDNWFPAGDGFAVRNTTYYHAEELVKVGTKYTMERDNLWVGGQIMNWHPSKVGDEIVLQIPILEDSKQCIRLAFALRENSGKIRVMVDGEPLELTGRDEGMVYGEKGMIDLCVQHRVLCRQYRAAVTEWPRGSQELVIRYEGSEQPNVVIGIDYVGVQTIEVKKEAKPEE